MTQLIIDQILTLDTWMVALGILLGCAAGEWICRRIGL